LPAEVSPRKPASRPPPRLPWGEIHPTLDLHGLTADEAVRRTERWLNEQRSAGVHTVRVITGRGKHSVGPPVLRGEIEALLSALRRTLVASFASEPGGGVFRVELKQARRDAAPRPTPREPQRPGPAPGEVAASLRRRAEEALAELGVEPTPELVRIEVDRILREDREER
jgi:hypothetical protein